MCQNCELPRGPEQDIFFLRRYLADQEKNLAAEPDNQELSAEVAKTRTLIKNLEETGLPGGDNL